MFAIAAAALGLSMMMWAKSDVAAIDSDIVRPKVGVGTYRVLPTPYLPFQVADPVW
jgi:hypothetical protein